MLFISILAYILIAIIQIIAVESLSSIVPMFKSVPVTDGKEGLQYTYIVEATGFDNDFLEYSLLASPTGMTIDSSTGEISWIPNITGSFDVKVKVSDREKYIIQEYSISVESPFLEW